MSMSSGNAASASFALRRQDRGVKRETFVSTPGKQKVLFCGMDCLPGQLDLFQTDGPSEKARCDDGESGGVREGVDG